MYFIKSIMKSAETESHYCNGSNGVDNPFTYVRIHIHMIHTVHSICCERDGIITWWYTLVRCKNE